MKPGSRQEVREPKNFWQKKVFFWPTFPKNFSNLFFLFLFFSSCTGSSDLGETSPVLLSLSPESGIHGNIISLHGAGFSILAAENIILVGGTSTTALTYTVSEENEETLTFEVPESALPGKGSVLVMTQNQPSNALDFTIEP